jgi:fumarylpyruvate hydrolase
LSILFDPPPPVLMPTSDGHDFPVRRVFCIGRNYADHAREMGGEVERDAPFYFMKGAETVVGGGTIAYPSLTSDYHHEAELVVAIGTGGRNIPADRAMAHVYGYAVGLDMTRRDLQAEAKRKGRPWDIAKNVEQSAPLGVIHPLSETGSISAGPIRLTLNGAVRQEGDVADMIHPVPDLIAFLSRAGRLEPGDLIYTGTPAGVGPVVRGDRIVVSIEGLSDLAVTIGPIADD